MSKPSGISSNFISFYNKILLKSFSSIFQAIPLRKHLIHFITQYLVSLLLINFSFIIHLLILWFQLIFYVCHNRFYFLSGVYFFRPIIRLSYVVNTVTCRNSQFRYRRTLLKLNIIYYFLSSESYKILLGIPSGKASQVYDSS